MEGESGAVLGIRVPGRRHGWRRNGARVEVCSTGGRVAGALDGGFECACKWVGYVEVSCNPGINKDGQFCTNLWE